MAELKRKNVEITVREGNKIIKDIDALAEKNKKSAKKLKDKAIDFAIDFNEERTPFLASSLVATRVNKQLQKIINNDKKSFNDFILAAGRYLEKNFAIALTKKDLEVIAKKQSAIIDELTANTTILSQDIKGLLTQNLATGIPKKTLILGLKDLYPAYERNASTIINTGLGRLFNDINVAKFQQSDFDWYLYAGPDDSITREIPCKQWVWHRFPASQLNAVSTIRQSLWNCRHSIVPLSDSQKNDFSILNLKAGDA